jgi:hypothetical protein
MARAVGVTRSWEWLEERSETSEAMGSTTMEDYPRQKDALFTVVAVEESHVVVTDANGSHYRARYIPSDRSVQGEPLRSGDVLIVNQVNPVDGLTVVERLTMLGERDGSPYELFDYLLASKSEPA